MTLTGNSLTLILPELDSDDTATNVQRNAVASDEARINYSGLNTHGHGNFDYRQTDRLDQSRVEIMTGGTVLFEGGSHTIAQGGQVSVFARKRTFVSDGAVIDVSGVRDVAMDMESNSLLINLIQPYDYRDSALNRENENLKSQDIWIDVRDLVFMPAGTGGAETDRYYTAGGLMEVSGHLSNAPHKIGEWASQGGNIVFASGHANVNTNPQNVGELIIQKGALLDVSGGSLDYASGYTKTTLFLGSDGKLYAAGQAPAGVKLLTVGANFMRRHERWGEQYTEYFATPFSRRHSSRYEEGYTVGRDAGYVSLSVPTLVMEGTIIADVIVGERQTGARPSLPISVLEDGSLRGTLSTRVDGYKLPQNVAPMAGSLYIGNRLHERELPNVGVTQAFRNTVTLDQGSDISAGLTVDSVLPTDLVGSIGVSLEAINSGGFGEVRVSGSDVILKGDLNVQNGGNVLLRGTNVDIEGSVTARSGTIAVQAMLVNCNSLCDTLPTKIEIADGVRLDTSGLWVNQQKGGDIRDMAYLAGGDIFVSSTQGSVNLGQGSLINASAGGAITRTGETVGAEGGNVVLAANVAPINSMNEVVLGGDIEAYGSEGHAGGKLTLINGGRAISIGGQILGGGDALAAGEAAPMALRLTEAVTIPAGTVLDFDFAIEQTHLTTGGVVSTATNVNLNGVTTAAPWVVPNGMYVYDANYNFFGAGQTLPAGTTIPSSSGQIPAGTMLQADILTVFPDGIPLSSPIRTPVAAGTPLPSDARMSVGATVQAGWVLPTDVKVAKPLHLAGNFFQKGFSSYAVHAGGDVAVSGGPVEVLAPTRRITAGSFDADNGARPETAMTLTVDPMFREDAVNGRFVQREGASLSIVALRTSDLPNAYGGTVFRNSMQSGAFTLAADASLRVDDGQSISVRSGDRMLIEGRIEARGGSVTLEAGPIENMNRLEQTSAPILYDPTRAIWLESGSVIDVSGRALTATDRRGLRYAHVSEGGDIRIGGAIAAPRGVPVPRGLTAAYVVVREGALLDASGASAEIDYLTSGLQQTPHTRLYATDGGRIAFDSQYGIFLDGEMRANAGGAGALGGELVIDMITPILNDAGAVGLPVRPVPEYMRRLRTILVEQEHTATLSPTLQYGECITGCWMPGMLLDDALTANAGKPDAVGQARISVERIDHAGFDSLSLNSMNLVLFDGDVDMTLGRNLTLSGAFANTDINAHVKLDAAYVNFAAGGGMLDITYQNRSINSLPDPNVPGTGSLTITGGLVDMAGGTFGVRGEIGGYNDENIIVDYDAPSLISIVSRSDIRLTGGTISTIGSINLTAAQIYPTTGAVTVIEAGVQSYRFPGQTTQWNTMLRGGTINIHKLDGVTPSAPLSLYGSVTLMADIINQGGNLVAPLGQIALGAGGSRFYPPLSEAEPGQIGWSGNHLMSSEVNLLPGSVTSISAKGLSIPYGGTTDGLIWRLNGEELSAVFPRSTLTVFGALNAAEGSTVDLSGGGTPAGKGFVPGRGGSVDILKTPLANLNPGYAGISDSGNKVFAIVPAYQHSAAPTAIDGHAQPEFGQQIVIPAGVEGLPAGRYMLLPANFALMPGAFRVEMGNVVRPGAESIGKLADGSTVVSVHTAVANMGRQSANATNIILTPEKVVRTHAQYNEMTLEQYFRTRPDTALFDRPMPMLPSDGKEFLLAVADPVEGQAKPLFSFNGTGLFAPAEGGIGGSLAVTPGRYLQIEETYALDILADGETGEAGAAWLYASDLNRVGASLISIGGRVVRGGIATNPTMTLVPGGDYAGGTSVSYYSFNDINVRKGAVLSAAQVFLMSDGRGDIVVEDGATITSVGKGGPVFDSSMGFNVTNTRAAVLAVSNGMLELSAPTNSQITGRIIVEDGATLLSDGTLTFVSQGPVLLGEAANYGARYLGLSSNFVNIGTTESLAAARADGVLPDGVVLTQTVVNRLAQGSAGAPRLERLILSANQSLNIYGTVDLDASGVGETALQLVMNTPAIYGLGTADDVATIRAGTLVWNGTMTRRGTSFNAPSFPSLPGTPINGGAGTGTGTLNFEAQRIVLGYQDGVIIPATADLDRQMLGFATVNLKAGDRIEANHKATISVWQSQTEIGKPGAGGDLNLVTPVLTALGDSNVRLVAGGDMQVVAPEGHVRPAEPAKAVLGGELNLTASSIFADTLVALPSGRLVLTATQGDIELGSNARLDMAGRATEFFDETRYSWGGDVELESAQGSISLAQGAVVDLSADYNHAGNLKVTALNGTVSLDGDIRGQARNGENAANPDLRNGSLDVRAYSLVGFTALNERLNDAHMTEGRSILVKTGDLVIGNEVKARHVSLTADGGSLTVNGRIDASGSKPGSIRLSARDDLTLAASGQLDAHSTALRVDGYGAPIEASNRATVELTSSNGTLTLAQGSTIDVSSPDNVNRGRIELNASRVGANDVAINASGPVNVKGAASIGVNAFATYQPLDGVIDQALMDGIHLESDAFINAAIANQALLNRMAGLRQGANANAFHFRPGVELVSADGGDLRVSGDLNLAGYRYASLNPGIVRAAGYDDGESANYGSGEAGVLLIRAADDLDIMGSITDGFGTPARTPDDNGWVLYPGNQGVTANWVQDYKLPVAIRLASGARLPEGATLTYDISVNAFTVQSNTLIAAETRLSGAATLSIQWTATADIFLPDGTLITRGTLMPEGTVLPAGTVLGAGTALPMNVNLAAMTWPKGAKLPVNLTLSGQAQLQAGDIIPRDSVIALAGLFGLLQEPVVLTAPYNLLGDPTLAGVTTFPGGPTSTTVLDFDIVVRSGTAVRRDMVIPFGFESNAAVGAIAGGWTTTAPIWQTKAAFEAGLPPQYQAGALIGISIPSGAWFGAGIRLPRTSATNQGTLNMRATRIPANTPLNLINTATISLNQNITVPAGTTIPVGVNLQPVGGLMEQMRPLQADGTQGRMWGAAPMLKAGSQSWSMRFVAGADLGSADSRALRSVSDLAQAGQSGDLLLSDRHYLNPYNTVADGFTGNWLTRMRTTQQFSVLRTGIGSLDLLAGGSYEQMSLFGVYTAGTASPDIGGITPDGYNVYNQPRATLAGPAANPWIGVNFDGYLESVQDYQAWYPDHGGDLLLQVQGNLSGFSTGRNSAYLRPGSGLVSNWLWRQGAYGLAEGDQLALGQDMPTAWWIHFGGYVPNNPGINSSTSATNQNAPILLGFMGIGTLGGGNLTVVAGGDAGLLSDYGREAGATSSNNQRAAVSSQGLHFAIGGTGRVTHVQRDSGFVTGGTVVQTGGGEMQIRIGGAMNPMGSPNLQVTDVNGSLTNIRGDIDLLARSIGNSPVTAYNDQYDPRRIDTVGFLNRPNVGGITVLQGDGNAQLNTRGTLNLAAAADPGNIAPYAHAGVSHLQVREARDVYTYYWEPGNSWGEVPGTVVPQEYIDDYRVCDTPGNCSFTVVHEPAGTVRPAGGMLQSSFTLWHDDTALNLFSAGGSASPVAIITSGDAARRDNRYWYPPIFTVTAPHGDIQWVGEQCGNTCNAGIPALELMPSPKSQVEFLAGGFLSGQSSVFYDGVGQFPAVMPIAMSGMSNSFQLLPNPFRPVWDGLIVRDGSLSAIGLRGNGSVGSNLAFQDDTATGMLLEGAKKPALFYAGMDVMRLGFGMINYDLLQKPIYTSSGAVDIRAGRDIVYLGTTPELGCGSSGPVDCRGTTQIYGGPFLMAGLAVHNDPADISYISAGRDILFANMQVAGPGNLVLEAGRNVYQSDKGRLTSVGPLFGLNPETRNGGASISVLTGVGAGGPNYDAFAALYLDPAKLADPEFPLVHESNTGKVAKTYEAELIQWLADRYDYEAASPEEAMAEFNSLRDIERGIFLRQVYYDELKAAGREYNDVDGPRFASYLRGRNAIALMFPEKDAAGETISYAGDLTMLGGSGVRTLFGGNIDLMVAGGMTQIGVTGAAEPGPVAGVLSMGSGDIDIFSLESVMLGQSRVFTTFGGDLFIWSVKGDINAGRGSKSTAVYQAPRRVYDAYGNVTLSPPTQNNGAGIATLAPIPEIPPGDVDLIAPLGVIDAGEAGIRVSGDVNLAALQVLNAANIQVEGEATGIPQAVVVDTGALTAASAAANAVIAQAAALQERARPQVAREIPSILIVRFVGFGDD